MDQTIDQIEADIARARTRLGSNLQELEDKVDAATDWRAYVRARPWVVVGMAAACGFAIGAAQTAASRHEQEHAASPHDEYDTLSALAVPAVRSVQNRLASLPHRELGPLFDNIAEALVAVATTQVKNVIAGMIPGFDEHFSRVEQRRGVH